MAYAVSQNYIAPGDPKVWRVVDGRSYLNYNLRAKELWEADLAASIKRGNANWPVVLEKAENRTDPLRSGAVGTWPRHQPPDIISTVGPSSCVVPMQRL